MKIISRDEAKALGLKRYFTGEPCSRGHVAERWVCSYACLGCLPVYDAAYQAAYRAAHKAEKRTYNAAYYAESADVLRDYAKRYRRDNTDAVRAKDSERNRLPHRQDRGKRNEVQAAAARKREAQRYRRERERIKARVTQYRKENPDKVREVNRICGAAIRAIRKGAPGKYSKKDILRLLVIQNEHCNGCGLKLINDFTVDHIRALSRGGTNWPDNLQLLCRPCNLSKGTKTMEEWREWLAHP